MSQDLVQAMLLVVSTSLESTTPMAISQNNFDYMPGFHVEAYVDMGAFVLR